MSAAKSNPVPESHGWSSDQYELVDFGAGRKLERFGCQLLDRPSPAAQHAHQQRPELWSRANYRIDEKGNCLSQQATVDRWRVSYSGCGLVKPIEFSLRVTPFGHVGLFPEHASTWKWLTCQSTAQASAISSSQPSAEPSTPSAKQFLNLFAYTGGASLVMAACGWHVTHVDSSAPTVAWARENAEQSGLASCPIRWLVDDARAFVARELRRARAYDAILLDPPAYGHGPKGKAWQLERDLPSLLDDCCRLLKPGGIMVLTGHTASPHSDGGDLSSRLRAAGHGHPDVQPGRTVLNDLSHRALDFGWYLRASLS